jgi:hypothetical protein
MKKLVINKRMAVLALLLVMCVFPAAADDFGLNEKSSIPRLCLPILIIIIPYADN